MHISDNLIYLSILIGSFSFIGGGFKYIDQAYDAAVFSKKMAWVVACTVGVVMGLLLTEDSNSGELLLAIIIGVTFMSKFDNWPFRIMGLIALLTPGILYLLGTGSGELQVRWLSLGILTAASVLDEHLDSFSEHKKFKIFEYRPILEITVLLAAIAGFLPVESYLSLFAFDLMYNVVKVTSQNMSELENSAKIEILSRSEQKNSSM